MTPGVRRPLIALAMLAMALLGATGLLDRVLAASPLGRVQDGGLEYLADLRGRATASYLTAFGLNSIVSFAQHTEVSAVVVTTEPGQLLDPVDDLVEQFSDLMLFSAASIGVQELIHQVGNGMGFRVFLPVALVLILLALWLGARDPGGRVLRLGRSLLVLALLAKLAIPLIALTGNAVSQTFLIEDYRRAEAAIRDVSGRIATEQQATTAPEAVDGWWRRFGDKLERAGQLFDKEQLTRWQDQLKQLSTEIITLIKIFLVETIILPVAFGWGLYRLLAGLVFGR